MDNHPNLLIFIYMAVGFLAGATITHMVCSSIARRRQRAVDAWHNLNHTATGSFVHALSKSGDTQRNKVQQRVTVGAEDE